ncbi:bifunctional DNA primase/polymerase [Streptomyces sp. NPDC047197]|uniref:bifunctional DNA primase/polymerase n=1 Tax=Streptomyces sp. NPDC047197 TaxID=3155477 RepID=UPI0033F916F1
MTAHLLTAALMAAARGWPVHPLRPGGKGSALHGERVCRGRGPCTHGHMKWEQRATCDPERIRRTWQTGAFNVGIAPGPAHLLVVDLDIPKGKDSADAPCGATNFQALCERAGAPWPATYTVRTPSGGLHLYFHTAHRLPSTAGTLAARIDTRGWGGNIVAAGSYTPHGAYTVDVDGPTAELPDWLHTLLQAPPAPPAAPAVARLAPLLVPGTASRRASVALEREAAGVAGAGEGGRNQRLLAGARALGRFVAWGEIPRQVVEEAFQAAGEAAGLSAPECTATIRSALNWSIRTACPREAA